VFSQESYLLQFSPISKAKGNIHIAIGVCAIGEKKKIKLAGWQKRAFFSRVECDPDFVRRI